MKTDRNGGILIEFENTPDLFDVPDKDIYLQKTDNII